MQFKQLFSSLDLCKSFLHHFVHLTYLQGNRKCSEILFYAFVCSYWPALILSSFFFFLISFSLPTSSPISTLYTGPTLLFQCTGTSKNYNRASEVTMKCFFNVGKCALILKSELGNPSSGKRSSCERPRWGSKHMFYSPTLTAKGNIAKHVRDGTQPRFKGVCLEWFTVRCCYQCWGVTN